MSKGIYSFSLLLDIYQLGDGVMCLGGIDEDGELTKPLGEQMAELPISPTISKVIVWVHILNGAPDIFRGLFAELGEESDFLGIYFLGCEVSKRIKINLPLDVIFHFPHRSSKITCTIRSLVVVFHIFFRTTKENQINVEVKSCC